MRRSAGRAVAVLVGFVLACPVGATAATPDRAAAHAAGEPVVVTVVAGLDFGEVQVGSTSSAEEYHYTNGATEASVTLSITGANAADFAIATETCTQAPLAPGADCTVGLTFSPGAEYARQAALEISDGVAEPTIVPLAGVGVLPESAVAWGALRLIGSAYTWTEGGALARSVSGTTQIFHAVVERYDAARYGVYYRRGTNASTWPYNTRLNPSTQFGARSTIAASGAYVYGAWSSFARANPTGTQPRVLYFRSNRAYGAGAWSTIRRLTSLTGRIDYPRLAASGSAVYVTYTDAATGYVRIQVSRDRGLTWRVVSLGTTTRSNTFGRFGTPVVAAYGANVAVAWVSTATGTVRMRSSANYGTTWGSTATLGTGALTGTPPSIAMYGTRVAVAWTGDDSMKMRMRVGTTWQPVRTVRTSAGALHPYAWPWTGQVALSGTSRVGIAWEACWAGCGATDPVSAYRSDMVWRESVDNGASWAKSQTVVQCGDGEYGDYEQAYLPSVIWPSAGVRYVMASRWYGPNLLDNVVFRAGTGSP